jgi:hypothetical protein
MKPACKKGLPKGYTVELYGLPTSYGIGKYVVVK